MSKLLLLDILPFAQERNSIKINTQINLMQLKRIICKRNLKSQFSSFCNSTQNNNFSSWEGTPYFWYVLMFQLYSLTRMIYMIQTIWTINCNIVFFRSVIVHGIWFLWKQLLIILKICFISYVTNRKCPTTENAANCDQWFLPFFLCFYASNNSSSLIK